MLGIAARVHKEFFPYLSISQAVARHLEFNDYPDLRKLKVQPRSTAGDLGGRILSSYVVKQCEKKGLDDVLEVPFVGDFDGEGSNVVPDPTEDCGELFKCLVDRSDTEHRVTEQSALRLQLFSGATKWIGPALTENEVPVLVLHRRLCERVR